MEDKQIATIIDEVTTKLGRDNLGLGFGGLKSGVDWQMVRNMLSPRCTTHWGELAIVRAWSEGRELGVSGRRDRSEGMSTLGPYQDPAVRAWSDALPNPDYWENCRRLREESLARARAEHAAQRGD